MTETIRAELHKIAKTRTLAAFPLGAVAFALLSFLPALLASPADRQAMGGDTLLSIARGPGFAIAIAMMLLGVLVTAGEFRHHTIGSALVVTPDRRRLLGAKAIAASTVAALASATASTTGLLFGIVFVRGNGIVNTVGVADLVTTIGAGALVAGLYALAGVGLGMALRDQTAAITVAITWTTVAEGVVPIILRQPGLFKWMPAGAANSLLGVATPPADLLPAWAGAAMLAAVAGALAVLGMSMFQRGDVA